jgi:AraC family transcriptional regulator of adaptative response/methylated-DNA-[protein]-cysteine methyltransferase
MDMAAILPAADAADAIGGPEAAGDDPAHPAHPAIARAIAYLAEHYADQPSLNDLAGQAGLHPHHFQRVFKQWAGISPKRFAQYLTVEHAKRLLQGNESVLGAALDVGLSGPGRLHDLFVACEAMTPGEYKARGRDLEVRYGIHDSPFGRMLIAVTDRGVCALRFLAPPGASPSRDRVPDDRAAEEVLADWSEARLVHAPAATEATARSLTCPDGGGPRHPLLLRGTNFQIKTWQALLRIPPGTVASYRQVAQAIGAPAASRAVGRAVGANPIALIIPCHRVIRETGALGGYRWGTPRKRAILAWEAGRSEAAAVPG